MTIADTAASRRDAVLAKWNTGNFTMREVGDELGIPRNTVAGILERARKRGSFVLCIDPAEFTRRQSRSNAVFRERIGEDAYRTQMHAKAAFMRSARGR